VKELALTLKGGAYPIAVGFDPIAGLFYIQNAQKPFIVFDKFGLKLKEFTLGGPTAPRGIRQFLVRPDGWNVLVLTDAALFVVEVPRF
jgi:hypothetical protein